MTTKTVKPVEIAKWFINRIDREAGETISHLKVQKLVYYAQAWHLANYGFPLFEEEIEAWTHGPVVLSVWNKFKGYGYEAIPPQGEARIGEDVADFLEAVFDRYGQLGAKTLERKTHEEYPWKEARGSLPLEERCKTPISKMLMRDWYGAKIGKNASDYAPIN